MISINSSKCLIKIFNFIIIYDKKSTINLVLHFQILYLCAKIWESIKIDDEMKTCIYIILCIFCAALAGTIVAYCVVENNAKGRLYENVDEIPYREVGLLLGTTPITRVSNKDNMFFKYRIDAAEQLYKAGKIGKLLISGDEHSFEGINEPECMRDSLVNRGVPADVIILDGKGTRTIYSVINAKNVYGFSFWTSISQEFHNERALYQADHLGLNCDSLQGYNARSPQSALAIVTYTREYFARVKMFIDLWNKDICL